MKEPDKIVGQWRDPLGRNIALSFSCWNGHILRNHPEMALRLEEVRETIERPIAIRREDITRLYFREISAERVHRFLKVVVRLKTNKYGADGFVATAFPVCEMEETGVVEWPV